MKTKKTIGILGGGQLGMFLCNSAKKQEVKVSIFSEVDNCSAKSFADEFYLGNFSKLSSLDNFINSVDLITVETENIPLKILHYIEKKKELFPSSNVISIAQDRMKEKTFINSLNKIKTTNFNPINKFEDLKISLNNFGGKILIKSCQFGYDGKNQYLVNNKNVIDFKNLDLSNFIAEEIIDFKNEFSVIVARDFYGNIVNYPPVENIHRNNILHKSIYPAKIPEVIKKEAVDFSKFFANKIDLVGILAIEMFLLKNNKILVNEIAPRPHNSGHWTMDGCNESQFDYLINILLRKKINKPKITKNCIMTNVIGEEYKKKTELNKKYKFYDYYKKKTSPKRKMAHYIEINN